MTNPMNQPLEGNFDSGFTITVSSPLFQASNCAAWLRISSGVLSTVSLVPNGSNPPSLPSPSLSYLQFCEGI
jgi:hypothetical protein